VSVAYSVLRAVVILPVFVSLLDRVVVSNALPGSTVLVVVIVVELRFVFVVLVEFGIDDPVLCYQQRLVLAQPLVVVQAQVRALAVLNIRLLTMLRIMI